MGRVLVAELRKAVAQRFVLALALAVAAIPLLVGLALGLSDRMHPEARATGFTCLLEGARWGTLLLALAALLLGALSIAQEKSLGTIAPLLTRPVGRSSIVLGKLGALAAIVVVLDALLFLVALATAGSLYGFEPIADQGYVLATVPEMTRASLTALALSLPALVATATLGFFLSVTSSGVAPAVVLALVVYFPILLVQALLGETTWTFWLFTKFTTAFLDVAVDLSRGVSTGFDSRRVTLGLLVPLATAIVFSVASLVWFRRSDVTA